MRSLTYYKQKPYYKQKCKLALFNFAHPVYS